MDLMKVTLFSLLFLPIWATASNCKDPVVNKNKQVVKQFTNAFANEHSYKKAKLYVNTKLYTSHTNDPQGMPGLKGLVQYMKKENGKTKIMCVIAEDDHVVLVHHFKTTTAPKGKYVVDFYKLKDGKITDHWDAIRDINAMSRKNPAEIFCKHS